MGREIVFARTRHTYDSYTDFWRLVELSEYPVVYVDEIDPRATGVTYIACPFNGEFFPLGETQRKSKILLWNLERPAASGGVNEYRNHLQEHKNKNYIDGVIVSDSRLAQATGFTYVPLGSHEGLGEPGQTKKFVFIHLMCFSYRRGILFDGAPDKPKKVFSGLPIASNGWGEERHKNLQDSWMMLNVHQDDDFYLEPLRFSLAAAYGLPILSESLYTEPFPYQNATVQFPMERLGYAMMAAYKKREELTLKAAQMRSFVMLYHSFRQCVERYVR